MLLAFTNCFLWCGPHGMQLTWFLTIFRSFNLHPPIDWCGHCGGHISVHKLLIWGMCTFKSLYIEECSCEVTFALIWELEFLVTHSHPQIQWPTLKFNKAEMKKKEREREPFPLSFCFPPSLPYQRTMETTHFSLLIRFSLAKKASSLELHNRTMSSSHELNMSLSSLYARTMVPSHDS